MTLTLIRRWMSPQSTIGEMLIDGERICFTLEDPIRTGPKVPGETAIPAGRYQVVITYSPKFKRLMPLIVGVPGYDAIRFHWGCTNKDTEGCVLTGDSMGPDRLYRSKAAFERFFGRLQQALAQGPVWLTILERPAGA